MKYSRDKDPEWLVEKREEIWKTFKHWINKGSDHRHCRSLMYILLLELLVLFTTS